MNPESHLPTTPNNAFEAIQEDLGYRVSDALHYRDDNKVIEACRVARAIAATLTGYSGVDAKALSENEAKKVDGLTLVLLGQSTAEDYIEHVPSSSRRTGTVHLSQ